MKSFSKGFFRFFYILFLSQSDLQVQSYWNTDTCKERCETQRQPGWRGKFQLDCYTHYSDDDGARKGCQNDCSGCISMCKFNNIIQCPAADFENNHEQCRRICDSHRKPADLDGFVLRCDERFRGDQYKISECQSECADCPHWVCNKEVNANIFYCPNVDYEKIRRNCRKACDYARESAGYPEHSFEWECPPSPADGSYSECQYGCQYCPRWICKVESQDDDIDDYTKPKKYTCPSLEIDPIPHPTTTKKPVPYYKSRCKERCDRFRLEREDAFTFDCQSNIFTSAEETHECLIDCLFCPEEICHAGWFHCPPENDKEKEYKDEFECERVRETLERDKKTYYRGLKAISIMAAITSVGFIAITIGYLRKGKSSQVYVPAAAPQMQVLNQMTVQQQPAPPQFSPNPPYQPPSPVPSPSPSAYTPVFTQA